ncbi:MAG: PQQ-binding-like beta-propeller repeat protein [Gammaproteobacteria bacterium]|nr:PQQ-binding-like beta-propeller repeat protein [Gammaproteobacteria bacterium]
MTTRKTAQQNFNSITFAILVFTCTQCSLLAQDSIEWFSLGNDLGNTRYSEASEITFDNFQDLEVVWEWDGASMGASSGRATPSYINGMLYTVAGARRHVVAIDPGTGETHWSYRLPNTGRWEYSMRADYGKGVAYAEVNGRGVVYIVTPGFFLVALDAKTGTPLADFGDPVPVEGFPQSGVVDLLADLEHPYDPDAGIPLEVGYITSSSPPIVVNDTVVVGNSAEQGYNQSRIENIPGDILAYDKRTGDFKWKFNVIPRPGEYGHETWENDAWKWTGDVSSWAPISADLDAGLVYIPTNGATIDYYGGFRPGDNLFGTSLIALHASTGERAWHFQMVHHDIWNYDNPMAPILLDLTMPDRGEVPAVMQVTKQSFVYAFNRLTGEPIWPIEERPVPQSTVPGEKLSPTQPFPTRPAPFDIQGISADDLVDWTPELHQQAIDGLADYMMGPLFLPPIQRGHESGKRAAMFCPGGGGGANITAPAVADPATGILYVSSRSACSPIQLVPGEEADLQYELPTGTTFAQYASGPGAGAPRHPAQIPYFKPPYSRITAINMNSGEHEWMIPTGKTPARVQHVIDENNLEVGNTGTGALVPMTITPNMLIYSDTETDGTPMLYAVDKATGETESSVEVPDRSRYGMSTWVHNGHQYIILQTGPKLTAVALPTAAPVDGGH